MDRTVAGVLEKALSRLFSEPVKVTAAGRTDSGVHASGQVVSLATDAVFPFERLTLALNAELPADCSVRESAVVDAGFSARFSAVTTTSETEGAASPCDWTWARTERLDINAAVKMTEPRRRSRNAWAMLSPWQIGPATGPIAE